MNLDERAEELASTLGADKAEVKSDLQNLVEYSVPLDEAVQSVRRKYGGDGTDRAEPTTLDVAEVTTQHGNVTVTARVLTAGKRSIRYQGSEHVITEGTLADGTGTINYTAWEEFDLTPGDTVTVGNASVREWDGNPELNLGETTTVVFEDETLEVPFDVGGRTTLDAVEPGDRGVTLEAVVLEVETKVIDGRDGETEILSGVLADETARLPFTDWEPRADVTEGAAIEIENAYVREFRGVPSVNLSEFTSVTPLDEALEVGDSAPRMSIAAAVATGGMYDVELLGNVVAVRDGSGLIQRCPECRRVTQKGHCRSHGSVEGVDDLRVKAILDDGTGSVTAILDANLTSEVYGGDVDDARAEARDAMDHEVVADSISARIVGREYRVRGTLSVDEYGQNLEATSFAETTADPADRAKTLLAEAVR